MRNDSLRASLDPGDPDELLALRAAAREIRMSANTLYAWAIRGRIPARKVAGRFVIRRGDLDAIKKPRTSRDR